MSDAKTDTIIHNLVPKHELMTAEEKAELISKLPLLSIPKIHLDDPALKLFNLDASIGDIIRIRRNDSTGKNLYYRLVIK